MNKFFFANILILLICFNIQAQYVCPRNMVDCSYGCGRFTDTNADGFCDWGLLSKDIKNNDTLTTDQKNNDTVTTKTSPKDTAIIQTKVEETKTENKTNKQSNKPNEQVVDKQLIVVKDTVKIENQNVNFKKDTIVTQNLEPQKIDKNKSSKKPYNLILISLATFMLYFLTLFLSKKKIIKKITHRRIWNVILLITFLVSGLFGLLLVIQINYNFAMDIFRTILYWHVQFGIAMSLIAIFHFLWHLKYYLNLFKKKPDDKLC